MKAYMRCKTTLGHRYYIRRCEDEVRERKIFHITLVGLPALAVVALAAAAGVF